MSVVIIAKAKADLEAAGQLWQTDCDAYKITNLAAQRTPGWQVIEKMSGVNCQGRKVDGIIANGMWYDVLVSGGPPNNANIPAWQEQGPQGNLIGHAPYPWPDPAEEPGPGPTPPPSPDTGDDILVLQSLNEIQATQAQHTELLDNLRNQIAAEGAKTRENDDRNTDKIMGELNRIVEEAESTLQKVLAAYIIQNRPQTGTANAKPPKK